METFRPRRFVTVSRLTALALIFGVAWSVTPLAAAETVRFASADPAATEISGLLFRPSGAGPFPAVVMLHGCAGMVSKSGRLKRRPTFWARWLVEHGYAALLVDSFSRRGLGSICGIAERPIHPDRERPFDAYGGLAYLQRLTFIIPERIGLMGWSNGAMTLLWTLRRGARQRPATLGHDFRAAVAFYPGCVKLNRNPYASDRPILLQVGAADDWTPAAPCQRLVAEANRRGGRMEIDAYPGAYHSFDDPALPIRTIITRNAALQGGKKTVHIGTDIAARSAAISRVDRFLESHLGR